MSIETLTSHVKSSFAKFDVNGVLMLLDVFLSIF